MKNKVIFAILVLILSLTSCVRKNTTGKSYVENFELVQGEGLIARRIYRDLDTDVLYIRMGDGYVPWMNADGTCRTYSQVFTNRKSKVDF